MVINNIKHQFRIMFAKTIHNNNNNNNKSLKNNNKFQKNKQNSKRCCNIKPLGGLINLLKIFLNIK